MDWQLQVMETTSLSDFTQAEIMEMNILFEEVGEESLTQEFCEELATSFSSSSSRAGRPAIQWEQVQSWFQNKQKESPAKVISSSIAPKKYVANVTIGSNQPESSQKPRGDRIKDLSELAFEAKSFKDNAWRACILQPRNTLILKIYKLFNEKIKIF
ncbi:hypothetical protein L1049_004868 [Liquidambar formosana]|uniref:Homeobox domain-containing protein n=1 Tax=Liquidambar formosana TaxID=63359 RepID=A0AAP0RTR7_LIQFO